jgi:hypothetical protein
VVVWVGPEAIFTGAAVVAEDDPDDPPPAAAGVSEVDVVVCVGVGSAVTVASFFGVVTVSTVSLAGGRTGSETASPDGVSSAGGVVTSSAIATAAKTPDPVIATSAQAKTSRRSTNGDLLPPTTTLQVSDGRLLPLPVLKSGRMYE